MLKSEIILKQISMLAKVDSKSLAVGKLSREEWSRVTTVVGQIADLPILIDDNPELTMNNIRERTLGAIDEGIASVDKNGKPVRVPVGAVAVDYLQRIRIPTGDKRNRHEQVGESARGCKELAKTTGLPVIACVQLKRIPEGRPGRRPTQDDCREAGEIESESDEISCPYRPSQYDKSAKPDMAEICIVKNRHGPEGVLEVGWDAARTTFHDLPTH